MFRTPWGIADSKQVIARGLSLVGTPSHGGFMVADGYARKHLSAAALLKGERFGDYYAFEEDSLAAIILLEVFFWDIRDRVEAAERLSNLLGIKTTREDVIKSLSSWHADYLFQRGIEPDPDGLKFFNENKQHDRMRDDKSPDLIVAAFGDHTSWVEPGTVGVITADDSKWLVKADEYDSRRNLNLLSTYSLVKAVQ